MTEINVVKSFRKVYKFVRDLGSGVYGNVYETIIVDDGDEKPYACKIVARDNDYLREVNHLIECKDIKGVLPLRRVFLTGREMLMEFDVGKPLLDILEDGLFKSLYNQLEFSLKTVILLLKSIHEIHERKIVHRDIKPGNVVMIRDKPYIIDFGYSKRICDLRIASDDDYDVVTTSYRAPEVFTDKHYGPLVDEWSIGCVLYECFSSTITFSGEEDEQIEKRIFSYVWWRQGIRNERCGKKPLNLILSLDKIYKRFQQYEIKLDGKISKEKDCVSMYDSMLKLLKMLLEPDPQLRKSSYQILQILGLNPTLRQSPVITDHHNNNLVSEGKMSVPDFVLDYFEAFDARKRRSSSSVFFHSIRLWKQCLLNGLSEKNIESLAACGVIANSYEGQHDKNYSKILKILKLKPSIVKQKADDIIVKLEGKIWIEHSGKNRKGWNTRRETANFAKILLE
jgi:serine/threonine protein kinase